MTKNTTPSTALASQFLARFLAALQADTLEVTVTETPAPLPEAPQHLRFDDAMCAVLLAQAVQKRPDILFARQSPPSLILEIPDDEVATPMSRAYAACLLPKGTHVMNSLRFITHEMRVEGAVRFLHVDPAERPVKAAADRMRRAFYLGRDTGVCVVVLCTDPSVLPPDVLAAADHVLRLEPLDAEGIGLVIEAVTGAAPTRRLDDDVMSVVTLSDLRLAVHMARGAEGSLMRLEAIARQRLAVPRIKPAPQPLLEDLCGYGEAAVVGLAMASDLRDYRAGRLAWDAMDRGLLLEGPPGTGKTTFAKAFAASAGVTLIASSAAQWQAAGHLGEMLKSMRKSFADARAAAPCVLFVDEMDSFGSRAGFVGDNRDYSVQVVNCLLEQLDGIHDRAGVVVLGATNNVAVIDPAILRTGRMDRVAHIPLPDHDALMGILRFHLREDLANVDLAPAAVEARGGSGADCEGWVRRALGAARRQGRAPLLEDLLDVIRAGRDKLSPELRRRIAVHESGHAIVAMSFGSAPVSLLVSERGGEAHSAPPSDDVTSAILIGWIAQKLGGREAERMLFSDVSVGAGGAEASDLAGATRLAASYHGSWGLGDLGALWMGAPDELTGAVRLSMLTTPIRRTLDHATTEARRALSANRAALERLAEALGRSHYLDAAQVREAAGEIVVLEHRVLPELGSVVE